MYKCVCIEVNKLGQLYYKCFTLYSQGLWTVLFDSDFSTLILHYLYAVNLPIYAVNLHHKLYLYYKE